MSPVSAPGLHVLLSSTLSFWHFSGNICHQGVIQCQQFTIFTRREYSLESVIFITMQANKQMKGDFSEKTLVLHKHSHHQKMTSSKMRKIRQYIYTYFSLLSIMTMFTVRILILQWKGFLKILSDDWITKSKLRFVIYKKRIIYKPNIFKRGKGEKKKLQRLS